MRTQRCQHLCNTSGMYFAQRETCRPHLRLPTLECDSGCRHLPPTAVGLSAHSSAFAAFATSFTTAAIHLHTTAASPSTLSTAATACPALSFFSVPSFSPFLFPLSPLLPLRPPLHPESTCPRTLRRHRTLSPSTCQYRHLSSPLFLPPPSSLFSLLHRRVLSKRARPASRHHHLPWRGLLLSTCCIPPAGHLTKGSWCNWPRSSSVPLALVLPPSSRRSPRHALNSHPSSPAHCARGMSRVRSVVQIAAGDRVCCCTVREVGGATILSAGASQICTLTVYRCDSAAVVGIYRCSRNPD